MLDFNAIGDATAGMAAGVGPILHGRTLYVDGDGLAYNCAGNEDTSVGEARGRVQQKVDSFQRACGADSVIILLTGASSHKGHRYALARAKPYQGQRGHGSKPKNWGALRASLEAGQHGKPIIYQDREADDGFGYYGTLDPDNTVIATQDKDMRMVPGFHLNWNTNDMCFIPKGTFAASYWDKLFGHKWFWWQMLRGDPVDFIPGVPKAYGKLCGEVAASNILASANNNVEAGIAVAKAYESHYGDEWLTQMMEQATLLWMRTDAAADWFNGCARGSALGDFIEAMEANDTSVNDLHHRGWQELLNRVEQAKAINDLQAQGE